MADPLPNRTFIHPTITVPRVTILVHTANRPEQLYRLMRFYASCPEVTDFRFLIADGSNADCAAKFDGLMAAAKVSIDYVLVRCPPEIGFLNRLSTACEKVETNLVILAADDDFYFLEWFSHAEEVINSSSAVTTVIGNYLTFDLGGFTAFSDQITVRDGGPEKFKIPWMEGERPEARLEEIGSNPNGIQIMTWYALQRTKNLRTILEHGAQFDLSLMLFERYYAVAQAALGRTVFTQGIFLARQEDADPSQQWWRREPMGFSAHEKLNAELERCTASFLADVVGLDAVEGRRLAAEVYSAELAMMRQADRRRWLRRIVNRAGIRRWLDAFRKAVPPPPRDPRLPQRCDPEQLQALGERVRIACRPDPAAPEVIRVASAA